MNDNVSLLKGYFMIHGIYIKSRPKHKWHLVSIAMSPEAANHDVNQALNNSKLEGNDLAEAGIQSYDSAFHIPEILNNLKLNQKLLYN